MEPNRPQMLTIISLKSNLRITDVLQINTVSSIYNKTREFNYNLYKLVRRN